MLFAAMFTFKYSTQSSEHTKLPVYLSLNGSRFLESEQEIYMETFQYSVSSNSLQIQLTRKKNLKQIFPEDGNRLISETTISVHTRCHYIITNQHIPDG
jgi:hypothetical protein